MKKFKPTFVAFILLSITIAFQSCESDDSNETDEIGEESLTGIVQQSTSYIRTIDENHFVFYSDVTVNASAAEVWSIMNDFDNMPSWSSTLQGVNGDLSGEGDIVVVKLQEEPSGEVSNIEFPYTADGVTYEEGVRYGWAGPIVPFPGIEGDFEMSVEPLGEGLCLLVVKDEIINNSEIPNDIVIALTNSGKLALRDELKIEAEN